MSMLWALMMLQLIPTEPIQVELHPSVLRMFQ